MNIPSLMPYAPLALSVVVVASLFAIGRILARRRRAAPALIGSERMTKMLPLGQAAAAAYEAAKRERMVIVTVAEATGGAIAWFAQSIASVVPVYRDDDATAFRRLDHSESVGTNLQSLYIQKRDYQTYIGWARSMQ